MYFVETLPVPRKGPRPARSELGLGRGPGELRRAPARPRPRPVLPPDRPRTRFPGRPDWPDPQSQSLFRSYGSILPISLTHISLSTRGSKPRRPDAEMGTVCVETGSPEARARRTRPRPPDSDPCDFLTCIFHGLALVHVTTQELCRSTATAWFSHTIIPFSHHMISRDRGA